ncbi:MAG: hypothetical protein RIE53_01955 [Rhodothermales bacterium]
MKHNRLLRVAGVAAAYVLMVSVNALANILPIGGNTTGAVSDAYASMFTPAGFTFAIWSIIYLGLLLLVVVQALPRFRHDERLRRMDGAFMLNGVLNAAWIVAWHHEYLWLSMAIMLGLLATLVVMYDAVRKGAEPDWLFTMSFRVPVSLYLAWICVATVANISILQSAAGWNNAVFSEPTWTLLKLAVVAAVAGSVFFRFRDAVFVAVVAWAAFGIQANQAAGSVVGMAAVGLCLACLLLVVVRVFGRNRE